VCFVFFFSSRRRHTSFSRDWSSDVCSSDLSRLAQLNNISDPTPLAIGQVLRLDGGTPMPSGGSTASTSPVKTTPPASSEGAASRSEERRVGKECDAGGGELHEEKRV